MGAMTRPTRDDERIDRESALALIGLAAVEHVEESGECFFCRRALHDKECPIGEFLRRFGG